MTQPAQWKDAAISNIVHPVALPRETSAWPLTVVLGCCRSVPIKSGQYMGRHRSMPFRTHVPLKWTAERDEYRPDETQRCIAPHPCAHRCVRDRLKYVSQLLVQICSSRPSPAVAHAPFTKVCRMRTGTTPALYQHLSHCAMSRARVRQPLSATMLCVTHHVTTPLRLRQPHLCFRA